VASRYPSCDQSWLVDHTRRFGYNGNFTRDSSSRDRYSGLPATVPLFRYPSQTTIDGDSATRRGAEARCISNFFVTAYQTTNSLHPCALVGI